MYVLYITVESHILNVKMVNNCLILHFSNLHDLAIALCYDINTTTTPLDTRRRHVLVASAQRS